MLSFLKKCAYLLFFCGDNQEEHRFFVNVLLSVPKGKRLPL